jgi:hypothetical protein
MREKDKQGIIVKITVYIHAPAWDFIKMVKDKYGATWGDLLWVGASEIERREGKIMEYFIKRKGTI